MFDAFDIAVVKAIALAAVSCFADRCAIITALPLISL
jgi:hypothetical protein